MAAARLHAVRPAVCLLLIGDPDSAASCMHQLPSCPVPMCISISMVRGGTPQMTKGCNHMPRNERQIKAEASFCRRRCPISQKLALAGLAVVARLDSHLENMQHRWRNTELRV